MASSWEEPYVVVEKGKVWIPASIHGRFQELEEIGLFISHPPMVRGMAPCNGPISKDQRPPLTPRVAHTQTMD